MVTFYDPNILYVYTVDDRKYIADIIGFGGVNSSEISTVILERSINRDPKNSTVDVHCDPANPQKCGARTWYKQWLTIYYIIALLLTSRGILLIISFFTGYGESLIGLLDR